MIARLGLLFSLLAGCASDWKIVDGDGDGISPADGDCWDAVEGPAGSGLSGAEINPGAQTLRTMALMLTAPETMTTTSTAMATSPRMASLVLRPTRSRELEPPHSLVTAGTTPT